MGRTRPAVTFVPPGQPLSTGVRLLLQCTLVRAAAVLLFAACGRIGFATEQDVVTPSSTELVIHGGMLSAAIDDLPVLVRLTELTPARVDGGDLRFFIDDDPVPLPFEVERITNAQLDVWVRIPRLDLTDAKLVVVSGDATLTAPPREDVWSADFIAVWHLVDGTDSTSNRNDGVFTGTTAVDGIAGGGRALEGGWLEVPDSPSLGSLGDTTTWSGWGRWDSFRAPPNVDSMLSRQSTTGGNDFRFGAGSEGMLIDGQIEIDDHVDTRTAGGELVAGTWAQLAMTWNAAELALLVDATPVARTMATGVLQNTPNRVLLGADCNSCGDPNDDFLAGTIDEVRIERVVRDLNWLEAQRLMMTGALVEVVANP